MSLRVLAKKIFIFWKRNNNKILILKIVRRILRIDFNYSLSIVSPHNQFLFNRHFVSKILLHPGEEYVDHFFGYENIPRNIPMWYREEYLVELSDVVIDTNSGIVFVNHENPISILESSNILPIEVSDYLRPRSPKKLEEGTWAVLSSRSFAHWLLQDVPRFLRLLEQERNLQIAIANDAPRYVKDMLKLCGIEPHLCTPTLRAANFAFISTQYAVGTASLRDIQTLRVFQDRRLESYRNRHKVGKGHRFEKIFVSRLFSNRTLPNEERLVEKARSTGFEVFYPEKMSLAEQIMIFEEAKVICATHGAGMANLVWAKKCRIIFEIYNDNFQTETYRMLAKRLNIAYSRVHYLDALDAHDIWID